MAAPCSPFSACPACSLACGKDQNDTIKNESSPASGFISYRKDTSDFFHPREHKSVTTSCLRRSSVPAHKHKLKANRHSPQTSATCLIPAKVFPSLLGFLVSYALELALIPADWLSGSLVCALLSTQCPRKAFPVLRSTGDRGRGCSEWPQVLSTVLRSACRDALKHSVSPSTDVHEPLSLGAVKAGGQSGRVGDRRAPGTLWDPGPSPQTHLGPLRPPRHPGTALSADVATPAQLGQTSTGAGRASVFAQARAESRMRGAPR